MALGPLQMASGRIWVVALLRSSSKPGLPVRNTPPAAVDRGHPQDTGIICDHQAFSPVSIVSFLLVFPLWAILPVDPFHKNARRHVAGSPGMTPTAPIPVFLRASWTPSAWGSAHVVQYDLDPVFMYPSTTINWLALISPEKVL